MDTEIGYYLQQLRTIRRISTSQLARRAGIGRATLHRWQACKGKPRLRELEAVLNEMAVSSVERTYALTLLTSPIKRIQKEESGTHIDYADVVGPQPHGGDLLRALRLRNDLTQSEVAQLAGTTQATVARWECAEGWPEQARLRLVAQALHVRETEFAALSRGPLLANDPSPFVELLQDQLQACWQGPHSPAKIADTELNLLVLAAQAWPLACRNSKALKLLADVYTVYAEHLYFQRRFSECEQMAQRAHTIYLSIDDETDLFWARAVLRGCVALSQKGSQRAIERAIRQLPCDFPGKCPVIYKAWMLSEMGKMVALRGQATEALRLGREAVSLARGEGNLSELAWRQEDLARIYLRLGHPQEALNAALSPALHPSSLLVQAEAYLMIGHREEARQALRAASEWIEAQNKVASLQTPYYRAELQALLAKL